MPSGGRRPGAGAPKGNVNALRSARYSQLYKEADVLLKTALPLRREVLDAFDRGNAEGRRSLAEHLAAAREAIRETPDLAQRIELAILTHRDRIRRIERGQGILESLVQPPKLQRLYWALSCAHWIVKHDDAVAPILIDIVLPPVHQALARRAQTHNQTIRQSKQPESESEQPSRH